MPVWIIFLFDALGIIGGIVALQRNAMQIRQMQRSEEARAETLRLQVDVSFRDMT
jgi:hypothetical protein